MTRPRAAATRSHPFETGGILVGVHTSRHSWVGAGARATNRVSDSDRRAFVLLSAYPYRLRGRRLVERLLFGLHVWQYVRSAR